MLSDQYVRKRNLRNQRHYLKQSFMYFERGKRGRGTYVYSKWDGYERVSWDTWKIKKESWWGIKMKNIKSFYIGQSNASGIICESKEEFFDGKD